MCGKTSGVGGSKHRHENLDPQTLLDKLLNDDERRRWLNEDPGRPGQVIDPNAPPDPRRDPNAGGQPDDPAPPVSFPRDPGGPGSGRDPGGPGTGTQPRDPGGPGTGTQPRDPVGPPGGLGDPARIDPTTGGGATVPRDTYTGGQVSGLAATEPPRDPIARGTGLLPSNAMLTRTAAIDYLGARGRTDLAGALRSNA